MLTAAAVQSLPSEADFLAIWEAAQGKQPWQRALIILRAACPETLEVELMDLPIGKRNKELAKLRCQWFGAPLQAWTACPNCDEKLELELDTTVFTGNESDGDPAELVRSGNFAFHLPTSASLARAANGSDSLRAAHSLAQSCLVPPGLLASWSEAELVEIGDKLAAADPFAETLMALHCPDCGVDWQVAFDMAAFLWEEIENRVRQIFVSVHTLAAAYGWTEREVLSLSPGRRAMYLELAQS